MLRWFGETVENPFDTVRPMYHSGMVSMASTLALLLGLLCPIVASDEVIFNVPVKPLTTDTVTVGNSTRCVLYHSALVITDWQI